MPDDIGCSSLGVWHKTSIFNQVQRRAVRRARTMGENGTPHLACPHQLKFGGEMRVPAETMGHGSVRLRAGCECHEVETRKSARRKRRARNR